MTRKYFQPPLGEFSMIRHKDACQDKNNSSLSTPSWGILYDSQLAFVIKMGTGKNLSTPSWGILYDSKLGVVISNAFVCAFNPLLGNSLWFQTSIMELERRTERIHFQPPLGEFSMILMPYCCGWSIKKLPFNPLLGNSLWFKQHEFFLRKTVVRTFNPLLGNSLWFFSARRLGGEPSWLSFNPLLGNSLWFLVGTLITSRNFKYFQPPLGEFSMIHLNKFNKFLEEQGLFFFQPPLGEFSMILQEAGEQRAPRKRLSTPSWGILYDSYLLLLRSA